MGEIEEFFFDVDQGGYVFFPCRFVVLVKTILFYVKRILSLYFNWLIVIEFKWKWFLIRGEMEEGKGGMEESLIVFNGDIDEI